jgi:glyoxylase-like metal-dependent hydrolase (beta-lactamase superfamily II)
MSENSYVAFEISPGAWRIENEGVRCILFIGTKQALLIDSGFGTGDLKAVVDSITSLPVMLVNTHADGDHTGCNHQFETAYMHPAEFATFAESGAKGDVSPIWDGDVIDIGGRELEVILIPGHTQGSIALLDRANRVLVGGDSVQPGPIFMFGTGRDIRAFIASMEKLDAIRSEFDDVYAGHGEFPVSSGVLPGLIAGAKELLAGKLEGRDPPFEMPAKWYETTGAAFFY